MVGVIDLALENLCSGRTFDELPPPTVKKLVAGSGKASKEEVAAALHQYVGKQTYQSDDESDALAAGIAWLIKNGYEVKRRE